MERKTSLNCPGVPLDTVWVTVSTLVHLTVDPRGKVTVLGWKAMFCIIASSTIGVGVPGVAVAVGPWVGVDVGVGVAVTAHGVAALARF